MTVFRPGFPLNRASFGPTTDQGPLQCCGWAGASTGTRCQGPRRQGRAGRQAPSPSVHSFYWKKRVFSLENSQ